MAERRSSRVRLGEGIGVAQMDLVGIDLSAVAEKRAWKSRLDRRIDFIWIVGGSPARNAAISRAGPCRQAASK